jgi:hypothetical protein
LQEFKADLKNICQTRIPEAFRKFARQLKLEREWQDVLKLGDAKITNQRNAATDFVRPRIRKGPIHRDRPVYGRPMMLPELAHEPTNELSVVFVFGMLARRLGFVVLRIQPDFPDCEAMFEVARGQATHFHFRRYRWFSSGLVGAAGPEKVSGAVGIPFVVPVHQIAQDHCAYLNHSLGQNRTHHRR